MTVALLLAFEPAYAAERNDVLTIDQAADMLSLRSPLAKGAISRGRIQRGQQLFLDDKVVQSTSAGDFVIGFGRNDSTLHHLEIVSADNSRHSVQFRLPVRSYNEQRIKGVEQKYVSPAPDVLERIRRDNSAVANARARSYEAEAVFDEFIWPLTGPITGVYGSQRWYNGEARNPHYGVDVAAPVGTPVVAPAAGLVVLAEPDLYFSGGTLIINHGFEVTSSFLHLSKLLVKTGQSVAQGDPIAEVGATGRVTGPHLDWRMNWKKARIDPQLLVPDMQTLLEK